MVDGHPRTAGPAVAEAGCELQPAWANGAGMSRNVTIVLELWDTILRPDVMTS